MSAQETRARRANLVAALGMGDIVDRVAVIAHGRIVACDTPDALVADSGQTSLEDAFVHLAGLDARTDA